MIKNPLSVGISHIAKQFVLLETDPVRILPSILTGLVMSALIVIFVVLWPYGLVAILEDLLRELMQNSLDSLKKTNTLIESMPFVFAIGLYFLVWIPFAALCLPFVIFGAIGKAVILIKVRFS